MKESPSKTKTIAYRREQITKHAKTQPTFWCIRCYEPQIFCNSSRLEQTCKGIQPDQNIVCVIDVDPANGEIVNKTHYCDSCYNKLNKRRSSTKKPKKRATTKRKNKWR